MVKIKNTEVYTGKDNSRWCIIAEMSAKAAWDRLADKNYQLPLHLGRN